MIRGITLTFLVLLIPVTGLAATFASEENVTLSEPVPDNAYLAGASVTVTTGLPADLVAAAGTVNIYAPVAGDVLAAAGTVLIERPVGGDVRAVGGKVTVANDVAGDVAVAGGSVTVSGLARGVYVIGGTVLVTGGATGPVTIYGADVTLSGDIAGDVEVIASDSFTLGNDTRIQGALRYNAPEAVTIPADVVVDGGITYTGSYAYVPTNEEAQRFAIAGAGIFFLVRMLAGMLAAGLVVGLFPSFARTVVNGALYSGTRRSILSVLLGFALFVASPILILLLLLTFVGAGVAFLLGALYLLLILLSYIFAAVIAGAALRRGLSRHLRFLGEVTWRDAVLGVAVLSLIGIIPVVGWFAKLLLTFLAAGALAAIAYRTGFGRPQENIGGE